MSASAGQQAGLIVANYGRHFLVEANDGRRIICHSRGKKSQGVVGDRVQWQASQDEGTI
ncbi:MAG: ribosome small subunit-dependent GTPase A, partial [Betaproteobacteria bacterium]